MNILKISKDEKNDAAFVAMIHRNAMVVSAALKLLGVKRVYISYWCVPGYTPEYQITYVPNIHDAREVGAREVLQVERSNWLLGAHAHSDMKVSTESVDLDEALISVAEDMVIAIGESNYGSKHGEGGTGQAVIHDDGRAEIEHQNNEMVQVPAGEWVLLTNGELSDAKQLPNIDKVFWVRAYNNDESGFDPLYARWAPSATDVVRLRKLRDLVQDNDLQECVAAGRPDHWGPKSEDSKDFEMQARLTDGRIVVTSDTFYFEDRPKLQDVTIETVKIYLDEFEAALQSTEKHFFLEKGQGADNKQKLVEIIRECGDTCFPDEI